MAWMLQVLVKVLLMTLLQPLISFLTVMLTSCRVITHLNPPAQLQLHIKSR
jgi:hypothetical protein